MGVPAEEADVWVGGPQSQAPLVVCCDWWVHMRKATCAEFTDIFGGFITVACLRGSRNLSGSLHVVNLFEWYIIRFLFALFVQI